MTANAINRVVIRLECGHNLLGDGDWIDEGNAPSLHDYCPGCGLTCRVIGTDTYRDEEAT